MTALRLGGTEATLPSIPILWLVIPVSEVRLCEHAMVYGVAAPGDLEFRACQ